MIRVSRASVTGSVCGLLLLFLIASATLFAQSTPPFQCTAVAAVPAMIRAEGVSELVGDLVLNCTGGVPAQLGSTVERINVQVFLSTNITSRLLSDPLSEALLIIDEPADANQRLCSPGPCLVSGAGTSGGVNYRGAAPSTVPNVFQGRQAAPNSVVFLGVPVDPPGPNATRVIRITNIRSNATQTGVSQTLALSTVNMYVSVNGSTSLPIANPQQVVAFIQPGLNFSVLGLDSLSNPYVPAAATGVRFAPCATYAQLVLRYQERFPSSFKIRGTPPTPILYDTETSPAPAKQNGPANDYFTESGFYNPAFPAPLNRAGLADSGTRFMARFTNLPDGAYIVVDLYERNHYPSRARLVATDVNGAGPFVAAGSELAAFTASGGSVTAVWEVLSADPFDLETIDFNVYVYYSGSGATLTSQVAGGFAPLSTVPVASSTEHIPRFVITYPKNAFTTSACSFNMLFPFVSNQSGFDTAMVISNTTIDPWVSPMRTGACTVYYYGPNAPPPQTSQPVPPGQQLIWTLAGGGNFGITATPGFQGYVIAKCGFPYHHGFASIGVGSTQGKLSYLPLVLDAPVPYVIRTGNVGEVQAH